MFADEDSRSALRSRDAANALALSAIVISMRSAEQRRARAAANFQDCPFPWRFLDADAHASADPPYDPARTLRTTGRELSAAEIGCYRSHVRALTEFMESEATHLLVVEDDVWVDFSFDFNGLAAAMNLAAVDYVRLYSRRAPPAKQIADIGDRSLIRYRFECFGTQAYLVTPAGARRLLAALTPICREIDHVIDRFWEHGLLPYAIYPHPVIELTSPSSLPTRAPPPTRLHEWRRCARRAFDRVRALLDSTRHRVSDKAFAAALQGQSPDLSLWFDGDLTR